MLSNYFNERILNIDIRANNNFLPEKKDLYEFVNAYNQIVNFCDGFSKYNIPLIPASKSNADKYCEASETPNERVDLYYNC